ncbi:NBR1-Ig-like domain-containing protein [Dactylosporangium sp. NPDC051485]|uniref:NBR1-Ig-like domain-containing protein n=1 Tax=Dactylosporangium sp. NPDC051485 TaxID=3154846 RepID=UPI00344AD45F
MEDQRAAAESLQDGVTAQEFAGQLRALRTAAGNPSFRKMAARSGRISHTTLHEAAAGTRFPSWETTREFVRACEADEVQWRRRWEDAQRPATVHAVPDGDLTAATADSPAEAHAPAAVDTLPTDVVVAAADEGPRARRHRLPWLAVAAGVAALVVVLGITVHGRSPARGSSAAPPSSSPSSSPFSDSLIPGDSSKFVADVTIPDGTQVKVNTHFVKVWALANVGTVDWHGRFLARMNPTGDDDGCQAPDRVAIGDTPPGQQVMISVPVTAPSRPAECWVSWKMVDESGKAYFPSRRPVYFMVTVVA